MDGAFVWRPSDEVLASPKTLGPCVVWAAESGPQQLAYSGSGPNPVSVTTQTGGAAAHLRHLAFRGDARTLGGPCQSAGGPEEGRNGRLG